MVYTNIRSSEFNNQRSGHRMHTPDFHKEVGEIGAISNNTVFFWKPAKHRVISLQAQRANRYAFTDEFRNRTEEYVHRSMTSGDGRGLNDLLSSDAARDSVTISDNVDTVIDLNNLQRNYWKFVLVLTKFNNKRMANGMSYTVIVNGRCTDEPVSNLRGTYHFNPNCELIIEGKTVFQNYRLNAFDENAGNKIITRASKGYGHSTVYEEATEDELYENTPGGMNHTHDLDETHGIHLTGEPVHRVGLHKPTTFDRKQQLPAFLLSKTMNAISKTLREDDERSQSNLTDLETSIPGLRVQNSSAKYASLVDNIRQAEASNNWAHNSIGPSIDSRLLASTLEKEYGVTNVKILDQDNARFFSGSDQTELSTRSMFESLLATQIPVLMIENQIHSMAFEAEMSDLDGFVELRMFFHHVTPALMGISQAEIGRKTSAIRINLEKGIFKQIFDSAGAFSLMGKINISTTSTLSLMLIDEGLVNDDHAHEFFPSDFILTTPMIGVQDIVKENQAALGYFLGEVIGGNSNNYVDRDDDLGYGRRSQTRSNSRRLIRPSEKWSSHDEGRVIKSDIEQRVENRRSLEDLLSGY